MPIDPRRLQQHLEQLMPRALGVLKHMVETNSFTRNSVGINRVGDLTAELFEPLGFAVDQPQAIECVPQEGDPLGRHLLLSRAGDPRCRIGMVGHLDTVFTVDEETANDFHWRPEGERIYGPGTMDMKAGNVLIWMVLHALGEIAPNLLDRIDWRVMFNAAEETFTADFGVLQRRLLGPGALANLVFEGGDLADDTHYLVSSRKGRICFRAVAHGRSAHAGVSHARGANAIVQMSEFVARISRITDHARNLTCNVGVIRGGSVVNRVPEQAEVLVEMRAYEESVLDGAWAEVMKLDGLSTVQSCADGFAARLRVDLPERFAAWPENAGSRRLAQIWEAAAAGINVRLGHRSRGGLSDGNFTQDLVPTLDGLGPAGANGHCSTRAADGSADQEYVLPHTFVPRAMVTALAIERLVQAAE